MKNLALVLLVPALLLASAFRSTATTPSPEEEAVRRAVLDYVEGFYEAKPELIERGVSEDLVKYGYWKPEEGASYQGGAMNFKEAVALAKRWNGDGSKLKDDAPKEIVIFDILDHTACAKLTAQWGIDYFQLAKEDGAWKIRHVLWQTHPPVRTTEASSGK